MDFSYRRITIFILYVTAAWFAVVNGMNAKCNHIQHEINDKWIDYTNKTCVNTTFCKRQYLLASVNMMPFSVDVDPGGRLSQCCHCVNYRYPGRWPYFNSTAELTNKEMAKFDFIYPVAGHTQKQTLYGWYFIPVIEIPEYVLITRSMPSIGESMMESLNKVLPLAIICILMALVSGFITWVCETWYNSEGFPRPLLSGWFEGTWWSFISMTTAGYGDATPIMSKSCPGRIFAIGWILIGLTMFGILTGLLTTAIASAENPAVPEIKNGKFGILNDRKVDLHFVAGKGGLPLTIPLDPSMSFEKEALKLLQLLQKGEVKGVVFDVLTYNRLVKVAQIYIFYEDREEFSEEFDHVFGNKSKTIAIETFKFFVNDAAKYVKTYNGDKVAYGVLVKDQDVYEYFRDAFIDNMMMENAGVRISLLRYVLKNIPDRPRVKLFELSSPYFIKASWILGAIIGGLLVIGIVIEVIRKSGVCKLKSDNMDVVERNENAMTEF